MSVSRRRRYKYRRNLKKQFPKDWREKYLDYVAELDRKRTGPPIGTLQDIITQNLIKI